MVADDEFDKKPIKGFLNKLRSPNIEVNAVAQKDTPHFDNCAAAVPHHMLLRSGGGTTSVSLSQMTIR